MSNWYSPARVMDYLRSETAGVSVEYGLLVTAMFVVLVPGIASFTKGIEKLFGFVGSLIR